MKQNSRRTLLDHWLWEPPMLKMFVTVGIALPVLGYGFVGGKIARIRDAIPPEEGDVIPGLIVRGVIESAGIVVLGEESLILHPLVGKPSATKLSEILSVREVSFFNGSVLWRKTGFWFTIPDRSRLACAIPNSYAERFRAWLSEGMKDGSYN